MSRNVFWGYAKSDFGCEYIMANLWLSIWYIRVVRCHGWGILKGGFWGEFDIRLPQIQSPEHSNN